MWLDIFMLAEGVTDNMLYNLLFFHVFLYLDYKSISHNINTSWWFPVSLSSMAQTQFFVRCLEVCVVYSILHLCQLQGSCSRLFDVCVRTGQMQKWTATTAAPLSHNYHLLDYSGLSWQPKTYTDARAYTHRQKYSYASLCMGLARVPVIQRECQSVL